MLSLLFAATFAAVEPTAATVTVQADRPGLAIPADFVGLSTEKKLMTRDCFSGRNTQLINLCRTLGPGVWRIGANNVDSTFYQADANPALESMQDNRYVTEPRTIGPKAVEAFFDFARATGWKVVYGVNLGAKDPAMAAAEAAYALQVGSQELLAIEIGNEPNLYPKGPKREGIRPGNWGYPQYKAEFAATADAIVARSPKAPLTGPAVTKSTKWMPLFLGDFKDRIVLATSHVYPLSAPETDPKAERFTSIEKLLGEKHPEDWSVKLADAQAAGVPFRIAECNSASGGGKRGVSNAFASALWSIDFLFDVARLGGKGVNLHGSFTANNYSPIVFDKKTGAYGPAPLYYGLLFFSQAAQGRLVPTETKSAANFTAQGVLGADGKLRVTLLNKDLTQGVVAKLDLGKSYTKADVWPLAAPSASATADVTFGGTAVTPEGKWSPAPLRKALRIEAGAGVIEVPAASAILLIAY